jgi:phage-related protein
MKEINWTPKALDFVRQLDAETKREIGTLLMVIQSCHLLNEPQSKPMKIIHKNAHELRIKDKKGTYRVIYVLSIVKRIQEFLNENKYGGQTTGR